jgi:Zn-dependent protease/predicted transcriptional regulator
VRASLRLGRIAGVEVGINWSALAIVVLIVAGLAAGQLPSAYPGYSRVAYVVAALIAAVLFLASLLAHEIAHAIVARRNGVQVQSIVLWLLGGVAQLEGEPQTPGADFRIAVVGPLTSLVLGGVFAGIGAIAAALGAGRLAVGVLAYLAGTNILLAIFNLIPAAPLDGGRVLRAALWRWRGDREAAAITAARAGRFVGFALVGLGLLETLVTGTFSGVWLALVGWFLVSAASAEEQQARMGSRLSGVRVADVMTRNPVVADGTMTLAEFVDRLAMSHRFSSYPLVDRTGRLTGLVTLNRVRAVPADARADTRLGDIACPPEGVPTAHPDEPLVALLPRMRGCADGRAVVLDEQGRVIGVVSSTDISRALQLADLRSFHAYPPPRGADLTTVGPTR